MSFRLVQTRLVTPEKNDRCASNGPSSESPPIQTFTLSYLDQCMAAYDIQVAFCFKGSRIDPDALELTLHRLMQDLPHFGGRLSPMQNFRLGSLSIVQNNRGVLLSVFDAPAIRVADSVPFQVPPPTGQGQPHGFDNQQFFAKTELIGKLMGVEPLMAVQLTHLLDGDILALTLCHTLTDGLRMRMLFKHIAARYRQIVMGPAPPPEELLLQGNCMRDPVLPAFSRKPPHPNAPSITSSLTKRCVNSEIQKFINGLLRPGLFEFHLFGMFIPSNRIQSLQQIIHTCNHGETHNATVGDTVQALAATLYGAASSEQLQPAQPCIKVVMQLPDLPRTYAGNGAVTLIVPMYPDFEASSTIDYVTILAGIAARLRHASICFRNKTADNAYSVPDLQSLVKCDLRKVPKPKHTIPITNVIPSYSAKGIDFGNALQPQALHRNVRMHVPSLMYILPSQKPYSDGYFIQMWLSPSQRQRLESHPVMELIPDAEVM